MKMRNRYNKIETTLGIVYLDYTEQGSGFICALCDSDEEFIANIYNEEIIHKLSSLKHISDLADIGVCNNLCFAEDRRLAARYCAEYLKELEEDYDEPTDEEIDALEEYVNRIGDNFFIVDYTEI